MDSNPNWYVYDTVLYRVSQPLSPNLAVFDLEPTLIHSDRGLPAITSLNDWVWSHESIPQYLIALTNQGYTPLIMNTVPLTDLDQIELRKTILKDIQAFIFLDVNGDISKSWQLFLKLTRITPSAKSFYNSLSLPEVNGSFSFDQELIVIVGQDGSGKEEYIADVLIPNDYQIIPASRDLTLTRRYLNDGYRVAVDGTNPTYADRVYVASVARELGIPTRIFWFSRVGQFDQQYSELFERPSLEREGVTVVRIN